MKKKMKIVPDRDDKNFCSMMCDYYEENRCLLFDKPIICRFTDHQLIRLRECKMIFKNVHPVAAFHRHGH